MSVFEQLNSLNVNDKTENKNGLTYLSWAWAWAEVKKRYPDATYTVYKNADGLPFVYDENTGYMCYTTVTIEGLTHEMWLPVMDGANRAMKAHPYTIKTKYKELTVEPATMFDINKTVMRCLTKNLAMFGLGLYIYAGEDLPEDEQTGPTQPEDEPAQTEQICYCERCSMPFEPLIINGVYYSSEQQAEMARQKRGYAICKACYDELREAQDE